MRSGAIGVAVLVASLMVPFAARAGANPNSNPEELAAVGGQLFFSAKDAAGRELWVSDGTPAGTHMVEDINPTGSSNPFDIVDYGGIAYFFADDGVNGHQLWQSDGTEPGTMVVKDVGGVYLTVVGNDLYFVGPGSDLWKSDGTEGGTQMVVSFARRGFVNLTDVDGTLFFISGVNYVELWKTNGTQGGTVLLETMSQEYGIGELTPVGDRLFFASVVFCAPGPCPDRLWKSNGTPAGTKVVTDQTGTDPENVWNLVEVDGTLYFSNFEGLWTSDGSPAGTDMVRPLRGLGPWYMHPTDVDGRLFFNKGDRDGSLWKSNGSTAGTVMVKDVGIYTCNIYEPCSSFDNVAAAGDLLFFASYAGSKGIELWKSDGTALGTRRVKDIRPGSVGSQLREFVAVGDDLYFVAHDGTHGRELWTSDGTRAGTAMVEDINT